MSMSKTPTSPKNHRPLLYLDYAATCPVYPDIIKTMVDCMHVEGTFANPASRSHVYGLQAERMVQQARKQVAQLIHATPDEVIWTSGATESNNLALKGIAQSKAKVGKHIISSQIEHRAVLDCCQYLAQQHGYEVTYLAPEAQTGLISPAQVEAAIRPDTILVSLMLVNNEIGTLTDIAAIGALTQARNIILHVDAAQAAGKVEIDVARMNIDLLSLSAHKFYGPKGIGALYVSTAVQAHLQAQMHGGGHEQGLRSGTLATHQIVGMGEAARMAQNKLGREQERLSLVRERLYQGLQQIGDVLLNGDPSQHAAHYLNLSFQGPDAARLIDIIKRFAAVSSSSACNSNHDAASHVLQALGRSPQLMAHSVRFSFGAYSTAKDIDDLLLNITQALSAAPQARVEF